MSRGFDSLATHSKFIFNFFRFMGLGWDWDGMGWGLQIVVGNGFGVCGKWDCVGGEFLTLGKFIGG